MEAKHVPDCLALELDDAVNRLSGDGWDAVVRKTAPFGQGSPPGGPPRVLRQKLLPSGQVELVVAHAC